MSENSNRPKEALTPETMHFHQRTPTTRLIALVVGTVLLAFSPLAYAYITKHAIPRWYLAYADNRLNAGKQEEAAESLDHAFQLDPTIVDDSNYWQTKLGILLAKGKPEDGLVENFAEHVIKAFDSQSGQGEHLQTADAIANRLLSLGFAKQAVRILESTYPSMKKRSPHENNQIAYAKAVAKIDLDTALQEIDFALSSMGGRPAELLDTKAWVLHQLQENERAIKFADAAIERVYDQLRKISPKLEAVFYPDIDVRRAQEIVAEHGLEKAQEEMKTKLEARDFGEVRGLKLQLQMIAVLRHHRASILEALGHDDAAKLDRLWLELFDFDDSESLI